MLDLEFLGWEVAEGGGRAALGGVAEEAQQQSQALQQNGQQPGPGSANVPASSQGIDAGKKIAGRKRHIGVDTLGLLLVVRVTAASISDNVGGMHLMSHIAATQPRVTKAWADTGYRTKAIEHGARPGINVEVAQRAPGVKGFKVIPRRRVVERTFGRLMHHRRLARD